MSILAGNSNPGRSYLITAVMSNLKFKCGTDSIGGVVCLPKFTNVFFWLGAFPTGKSIAKNFFFVHKHTFGYQSARMPMQQKF